MFIYLYTYIFLYVHIYVYMYICICLYSSCKTPEPEPNEPTSLKPRATTEVITKAFHDLRATGPAVEECVPLGGNVDLGEREKGFTVHIP